MSDELAPSEEHIQRSAGALMAYLDVVPKAYREGGDADRAAELGHTVREEARLAAEARRRESESESESEQL